MGGPLYPTEGDLFYKTRQKYQHSLGFMNLNHTNSTQNLLYVDLIQLRYIYEIICVSVLSSYTILWMQILSE